MNPPALAAEALNLENEVSNLVNDAYGLTPEEVALTWEPPAADADCRNAPTARVKAVKNWPELKSREDGDCSKEIGFCACGGEPDYQPRSGGRM